MTVADLDARMSNHEFTQWVALNGLRRSEAERAERQAKAGMRGR